MAEFDIKSVQGNDRFIAGGAVVILILSFLPWYEVSFSGSSGSVPLRGFGSASVNAWHAYGWNKVAILLALVAGALVIARLAGALDSVNLPTGINLIILALSGLASLILVLRFVTAFKSAGGFSAHPAIGWYLAIAVSLAMTYFAFLNFSTSGERLPGKPG